MQLAAARLGVPRLSGAFRDFFDLERVGLPLAGAATLLWVVTFTMLRPVGVGDELLHFEIIQHLAQGRTDNLQYLGMWPTYHVLIAVASLGEPTLWLARCFTAATALALYAAWASAWRIRHGEHGGIAVLLLASLPILQPFTGMVYTDVPALALVMGALAAQLRRHYVLAALLALGACALRQSNIVWVAFLVVWELRSWLQPRFPARSEWAVAVPRVAGLCAVLALCGAFLVFRGTLPNPQGFNRPAINGANLHCAAHLWVLLMVPVWIRQLPKLGPTLRSLARQRPALLGVGILGALAVVGVLALTYANPHEANRPTEYWRPLKLHFLRNFPLVWMETQPWLRWFSSVLIVGSAASLAKLLWDQSDRASALLALAFGVLFLLPHSLVEPRYFIPPAVFLLFFVRFNPDTARSLVLWWAFVCAIHAPFIAWGRVIW